MRIEEFRHRVDDFARALTEVLKHALKSQRLPSHRVRVAEEISTKASVSLLGCRAEIRGSGLPGAI